MDGEIALQISQDETMGKYLVFSASDIKPDDFMKICGLLEWVIE